MMVHLIPHVKDDPLRDPRINVRFKHGDRLRGGQRNDRKDQKLDQERQIFSDQSLIHDPPGNDRRQQADDGCCQYRDKYNNKLQNIRFQIPEDTF